MEPLDLEQDDAFKGIASRSPAVEVIDDRVAAALRNKTPAERLGIAFNMWISARRMLLFHIKRFRPDWSEQEVEREVSRRFLHGALGASGKNCRGTGRA
jgi:hypothetical protein